MKQLPPLRLLSTALVALGAACVPVTVPSQTTAAETAPAEFASGNFPISSLVQAGDLNFYGATEDGGASSIGSIYRLTPAAALTTLYGFSGGGSDGGLPVAGPVVGADGSLYGTTLTGGANNFGGVYRVTLAGEFTLLHSFDPDADGNSPNAALSLGSDGTLYGTLAEGAYDATTQTYAAGAIFALSPAGVYANLYSFPADASLGSQPAARLLQASDGNLWGATTAGGANGYGTIFRYSPVSNTVVDVYDLTAVDGTVENGLVEQDGLLYGVTFPDALDSGEIFSLSLAGDFSVVYTFTGGATDGGEPASALFPGSDGALYGTTQSGGSNGSGTFFRLVPGTAPVPLFSFAAGTLNTFQDGILVEGSDRAFYMPVLFDSTAGLTLSGMDGAGLLLRLAPAYPATPPPPVSLAASTLSPASGSSYTLTWAAVNAASLTARTCFASGGWSGQKASSGTSAFTASGSPVTYALTCGGNVSAAVTVTPTAATAAVTLTGPASVREGQAGTLSASVSGNGVIASGTITFVADGLYTLGSAALSKGAATLTASTAGVPMGTYSIQARYSGDGVYPASSSNSFAVAVTPARTPTSTALTVSPDTVAASASATLTATVTVQQDSAVAAGTVSFYGQGYALGSATVSSGVASLKRSTAGVPPGTYPVYAVYSGDANNLGSTSSVVSVTVQ